MSKKVLSLVLALVMVLGSFGTVFAAAYPDVKGETADAVDRLSLLGILEGYPDGTFKPEGQITRAEFAAVAVRAKGLKAVAAAAQGLPTGFSDVPGTFWASGVVGTAARLGIVNGVGNGQFAPQSPVKYEEAITMLVRALGYEAAAQAKGGYPYGYLIVAKEVGLLEAVKGTQGVPATRGIVAQLTDNALEIPMMVQVGFGSDAKWVVSGTENTKVRLLLDEMGFDSEEGRVVSFDTDRNRVTLDIEGKSKTVKVNDGFDFNFVEGLTIKTWLLNDTVVVYSVVDEAILAVAKGGDKIEVAGKKYAVARGAYLELNGDDEVEAVDFTADYAKVVLNEDNEIVWAKGIDKLTALVVKEVKEEIAYDFSNGELKLANYTVLKDGKTLEFDDIVEEDILLYNHPQKFAIVYNNSKVGEIERVYTEEFRFDGKTYAIAGMYLDGKEFAELSAEVLANMRAEEKDVEVFFNTQGKVVLVVGSQGKAVKSSFFGLVTNATEYTGRKGDMVGLDVRNEEGKILSYDLAVDKDGEVLDVVEADLLAADVLKLTIDKDDKLTKIEVIDKKDLGTDVTTEFKLEDSYVEGFKLQSSTIIFHDGGKKAVKLGDADFTKVTQADIYVENNKVVVVVGKANTEGKEVKKTDLVTNVRQLRAETVEFTFFNGDRYVTKDKADDAKVEEYVELIDKVVELTIDDKTELVISAVEARHDDVVVDKVSTGKRTIDTFELVSGAKLYDTEDKAKTIVLSDLTKGDKITVYYDTAKSDVFVNFVVRTEAVDGETETPRPGKQYTFNGVMELDGNSYIQLDDTTYPFTGTAPAAGTTKVTATFTTIRGEVVVTAVTPAL